MSLNISRNFAINLQHNPQQKVKSNNETIENSFKKIVDDNSARYQDKNEVSSSAKKKKHQTKHQKLTDKKSTHSSSNEKTSATNKENKQHYHIKKTDLDKKIQELSSSFDDSNSENAHSLAMLPFGQQASMEKNVAQRINSQSTIVNTAFLQEKSVQFASNEISDVHITANKNHNESLNKQILNNFVQDIDGKMAINKENAQLNETNSVFLLQTHAQHHSEQPSVKWGPVSFIPTSQANEQAQNFLKPIREHIKFQIDHEISSATVQIEPPKMGKVDLNIRLDGDKLYVQMHAVNNQVRDALQSGIERLKNDLSLNYQGDIQLDVSSGNDSQQSNSNQQSRYALNETNVHRNITDSSFSTSKSKAPETIDVFGQVNYLA